MNLLDYTKKHGRQDLAVAIGSSTAYISQLSHGHRMAGARTMYAIEQATDGEVTGQELRPDIFGQPSDQAAA